MTSKSSINHDGLLTLDQSFIKVPYEQMKKAIRTCQKYIEKEMGNMSSSVSELDGEPERTLKQLNASINRLKTLKRKLSEIKQEETKYTERTKIRIEHLEELTQMENTDSDEYGRWSQTRLNRLLAEYFLRQGYEQSAIELVQETNSQDYVDLELFQQFKKIEDSLRNHSCQETLQWCNENKSSLKKTKSTLEFNLRLQEYIELIRAKKMTEAIVYARKYLTTWAETNMDEIQQGMALLAYNPHTICGEYKHFFDETRWKILILQFQADNYALNNLTAQSSLNMMLQAGLSALKTRSCHKVDDVNVHCPVCHTDTFGLLATKLPFGRHEISCLVCRISGRIMNEDDPPLVLPNGYVYSTSALHEMANNNNGSITCPRSGVSFHISQLRKAFIV